MNCPKLGDGLGVSCWHSQNRCSCWQSGYKDWTIFSFLLIVKLCVKWDKLWAITHSEKQHLLFTPDHHFSVHFLVNETYISCTLLTGKMRKVLIRRKRKWTEGVVKTAKQNPGDEKLAEHWYRELQQQQAIAVKPSHRLQIWSTWLIPTQQSVLRLYWQN